MLDARIRSRPYDPSACTALIRDGLHPVVARAAAARGVRALDELRADPARLLRPDAMKGIDAAAAILATAIAGGEKICIVADYDCDGATACALAVRGLRRLGAVVDYLVPNRFEHGYGLGPEIVAIALTHPRLGRPDILVTVDNGIASIAGVAAANAAGLRVVVTDHHLAGEQLPDASAIVNPNQPGCPFPSKHLAGVGVMFYVLLATRAAMRAGGAFAAAPPPMADLLDLVAIGTVADVVRLDANNRILVGAGLARIRAGRAAPGVRALVRVAGLDPARVGPRDLGFTLAPRINAAGRLADISLGIECLLADDPASAERIAATLDEINRERRRIEQRMRDEAVADLPATAGDGRGIVLFRPTWHEGLVGLVAGRVKDREHRPCVAFASSASDPGLLKGSARSIAGVHVRDVLARVDALAPGLMQRFGGHAMAAGLVLRRDALEAFSARFEQALVELADEAAFERVLLDDGPLAPDEIDFALIGALEAGVWGHGFPAPAFCNRFVVKRQRRVAERHLKLELELDGRRFDAIAFDAAQPLAGEARLLYRPTRNEYRGVASVQLTIEAVDSEDR